MNSLSKEELLKKFEKHVEYLRRNIPPDDIYIFTEQTFMAALFFLKKWSEWADITEEMAKCPVTAKWVTNILSLQALRDREEDVHLDLDMKSVEP